MDRSTGDDPKGLPTRSAPSSPSPDPFPLPAASGLDTTTAVRPPTGGLAPGEILGNRYRIVALLGRGGMGEVWQAYDLKLQVDIALKAIRAERFPGEQGLELLRREVRTAREVMSPNVCRIFDLVEEEGQELVSMEYVDGENLLEVLRERGPLQLQEATRLASQFLAGLEAIHRAGLVHRDVKPENIMITRTGRVVLMDFGIAKGIAESHRGTIAGTRAYMAPEQSRGEALDGRADIFAAGVVLAEMIAPEGVREQKAQDSIWHSVRQVPVRLFESPWREVLEKAVADERTDRYASAREFARALEEVTLRVEGAEDKHPYPGLESFTEADAEFFFGREQEIEAVWKKLQRSNLLGIIGPSGAGKTSFLQAGLLPARPAEWRHVLMRPGSSPFVALTRALLPELSSDKQALDQLVQIEDPEQVFAGVSRWRQRYPQALIVVDQFEELFTLCRPELQAAFANLLGRLASEADIHVLVSMRDDFLFDCQAHSRMSPVFSELTPLAPPTGSALRRALVQPALLCGYRLEDESMADEMLGAIVGERGAMPMLAFAAARLWEHRDRERGLLTREAYERIGGVSGALAQHAEATLERIGVARQPIVREFFRNLVTAQSTRRVVDVEDLLSVFEERTVAEEVLRALINARLLTSFDVPAVHEGDREQHRVEIVHESLLASWPRLVHWQTQDVEGAQLRDQLRQAAQLWKERNKSQDLLWTGTAYKEYGIWRERYSGGLTETEEAFGAAMQARAQRDRRRRQLAMSAVLAMLLSVIATISWYGNQQRLLKLTAEAGRLVEMGRNALSENPSAALAYAIASLERSDEPVNRRFALEVLSRGPMAFLMPIDVVPGSMTFSPDGNRLAAVGWLGLKVYSRDGSPPLVVESYQHNAGRRPVVFAPDGDRFAWQDTQDRSLIRIWSVSRGSEVRTLKLEGNAFPIRWSDEVLLSTISGQKGSVTIVLRTWTADESPPTVICRFSPVGWGPRIDYDPTGRWMAYSKGSGVYVSRTRDLDMDRGRLVGQHLHPVSQVVFDTRGARIASADTCGEVRVWSVDGDPTSPLHVLHGDKMVRNLAFDPAGTLLAATCGPQQQVWLWDLNGPRGAYASMLRIAGAGDRLGNQPPAIQFDPSGEWLAAEYGANIAFWPVRHLDRYILPGESGHFAPDGQLVVADDHTFSTRLEIQDLQGGPARVLWEKRAGIAIEDVVFFGPARHLAVGAENGAYLVSMEDGQVRRMPDDPLAGWETPLSFSPDGTRLAAAAWGKSRAIRLWDLGTNAVQVLERSKGMEPWSLAFSEDGCLYSDDNTGNLFRWNIADGSRTLVHRNELPHLRSLTFERDNRFALVVASSDSLNYRGFLTRLDLKARSARAIPSHGDQVRFLGVDSSKTCLATSSADDMVRVGPISGEEPHKLFAPGCSRVSLSPDGKWVAVGVAAESGKSKGAVCLLRRPEGRPLHTLPRDELLVCLRSLTNLRVVSDKTSPTGYRLDKGPFPGWESAPSR